jgi:type II secretory pathway component GspD/PulD (secretin)
VQAGNAGVRVWRFGGTIRDVMRTLWVAQVCLMLGVGLSVGRAADARAFEPPMRAPSVAPVLAPQAVPGPSSSLFGAFASRAERDEKLDARLSLYIRERALDAVFNDVAQIAGLRMRINDRLDRETVSQRRLEGSVREILEKLATEFNLVWFSERDLVDISRADTATVKTFQIGGVRDATIRDAIDRFGLINADFALEVDESNGVARVFAPPRLSSRIESIIVGLRAPVETDRPIEVIRFGQRGSE